MSSFFIRGLLAGAQYGSGKTRWLWGLFGQYDFAEASLLRVSSVGFGLGISFQTVLPANFTFQLAVVQRRALEQLSDDSPELAAWLKKHQGPPNDDTVFAAGASED